MQQNNDHSQCILLALCVCALGRGLPEKVLGLGQPRGGEAPPPPLRRGVPPPPPTAPQTVEHPSGSHIGWRPPPCLQCTASLPGGSRPCNPCNALPHCLGAVDSAAPAMHCLTALGAVGSATPAVHCLTAWGQRTVQLLQCTAPLPGGSGQCNSPIHALWCGPSSRG